VSAALQTGTVKGGLSLRFQGSDGGNTEAYSCSLKKGPPPTPPVVSGAACESAKVSKASAGAFETAARALEGDFAEGMNGEFKLACKAGATPLDVLKGAIAQIDDEPGQFVYKLGQSAIAIDQQEAGTLADGEKAALSAISDADASTKAAVKKHIEALKAASPNAIFGYYGFQQNGCAAPSPGLIVVDPTTGFGVQIDMDPCHE